MKPLENAIPLAAVALALASGCASTKHLTASESLYYTGQYKEAQQAVRSVLDEEQDPAALESPEHILDNLYAGSTALMCGEAETAAEDFRRAGEGVAAQDAAILLSGYPTRAYDATMAANYRALALWMQGDADATRVAFRLVADAQDKAEERNARAIRRDQDALEKRKNAEEEKDGSANSAKDSGGISETLLGNEKLAAFQSDFETWGVYASYQIPSAWFLDSLFALANAEEANDLEHSSFAARKTLAMAPSKPATVVYKLAEAVADGKIPRQNLDRIVVVIFENGLGPRIDEQRFDLPVPFDGAVYNVSLALPKLVKRDAAYPKIIVRDGPVALGETEPISDFDRVAVREFKGRLPGIVASQVFEAALKLVGQVAAAKIAEKKGGAGAKFLASLAASAVSSAITGTDTRHWNYLPKELQAVVLQKPATPKRTISLWTPGGTEPLASVDLSEKGLSVVYIKVPAPGLSPLVSLLETH